MKFEALKTTPPWEWPDGADRTILSALQNSSAKPEDRELAAEMAGDSVVVNPVLIGALLEITGTPSEDEDLRSACIMALGPVLELLDMGDLEDQKELRDCAIRIPEILQTLHLDTGQPTILRRRALETSVRLDQDWHSDAVTVAFNSGETDWRRTAVFAMRFVPGFGNQILESLSSDDADTEFQAVCAADAWQIDQAWSHVLNLARDNETEKYLRMAALEAMASIRPDEAAGIIVELGEFEDEDLNDLANEILGMIGHE